jgi:hypothetical protein
LERRGLEVGRVADYVIAPLISAFLVSGMRVYLNQASRIGDELLRLYGGGLLRPFIGVEVGQFGSADVMLDSISSVYPVFAALAVHTQNGAYIGPVQTFLDRVNQSIWNHQIANRYELGESNKGKHSAMMDVPWKIYADIARIRRILPSVRTDHVLSLISGYLSPSNPVKYYDRDGLFMYSVHPCSAGAWLPQGHGSFPAILKKCGNLVKRNPLPSRLNGASECGTGDLETGFAFEGELIELFWRTGQTEKAEKMIGDAIRECRFGDAITGMMNATAEGRDSDNFIHPELFSRWVFNGALIAAEVPFEELVLSEGGHILKKGPNVRFVIK